MLRTCKACPADISARDRRAILCQSCATAHMFDPLQYAAHRAVAVARSRGELVSPRTLSCTDCGGAAIEYDHREYAKPLQVDPVCRRCNLLRGPAVDSAARDTSRIKARKQAQPTNHSEA